MKVSAFNDIGFQMNKKIRLYAVAIYFALAFAPLPALGTEALLSQAVANAESTSKRLEHESASWTTTFELQNSGLVFRFDIFNAPEGRSTTIRLLKKDEAIWAANILDYKGVWFVSDMGENFVCRPYEAPLSLPVIYSILPRSEIALLLDAGGLAEHSTMKTEGDMLQISSPVTDEHKKVLKTAIALADKTSSRSTQNAQETQALKRLLLEGWTIRLNVTNGIVSEQASATSKCATANFRWEGSKELADPRPLRQWSSRVDHLKLEVGTNESILLISHAGGWRKGFGETDTDSVLLDINTGKIQRLPYQDGVSINGCFSRDRRKAYVAGHPSGSVNIFPIEVDLISGENRPLDLNLPSGRYMFPTVSPDGKRLAVLSLIGVQQQQLGLVSSIYVIDLQTLKTTTIGAEIDCVFLSWLPDDKGLLLMQRTKSPDENEQKMISTINWKGEVKPIMRGDWPICMTNKRRILFKALDGRWSTSNMDGADIAPIGEGLQGFGFPTISPDETRVVMMRFGGDDGPRPYVVEIDTGKATPIPAPAGLWTMPGWK